MKVPCQAFQRARDPRLCQVCGFAEQSHADPPFTDGIGDPFGNPVIHVSQLRGLPAPPRPGAEPPVPPAPWADAWQTWLAETGSFSFADCFRAGYEAGRAAAHIETKESR